MKHAQAFLLTLLLLFPCIRQEYLYAAAQTRTTDLRVQNSHEPLAVEDRQPDFSWRMESPRRGAAQTAWRLQVTRESDGSELWDSGRVEDGNSQGIRYAGVALQPEMGYGVALTVWDDAGESHQARTRFETGLLNARQSAWKGAQWIGSKMLTLDAASQCLFDIRTDFEIRKGSVAALILGADDFRLKHAFQNPYSMAGEHYIQVEMDLSIPELRLYRVGYFPEDRPDKPFLTISKTTFPETNLDNILSVGPDHSLEIHVETSVIRFRIDGKDLTTGLPRISLNKMGDGGDFISFPNLCSVGFAAAPGSEVIFRNYQILNAGQSEDRIVFDKDRYGVFALIPGVTVEGAEIRVSNPGTRELKGWADPSHGAETQLRTEFQVVKKVRHARLYATSMGIHDLFLNGKHVGDSWYAPGDSQYREVLGYHKYDVTELLKEGGNALAASLAGGWFSGYMTFWAPNFNFFGDYAALLARLVITYEDGTKEEIVTRPDSWKAFKDGPVRLGSFFQGERYDARKETEGWTESGFDDREWTRAELIEKRDWMDFDLMARYDEPVRIREVLTARRMMPASDAHTHIYDMGTNMVGVPEITIPAGWLKEGDTVILTYGEQLYPGLKGDAREHVERFGKKGRRVAGHILYESNRAALDADFYTASGAGPVTIRPTKTFRGYQYIQVYIPDHEGALPLDSIKGLVLSSTEVPTGRYTATTSDGNRTGERVNQLFRNIQRSQLGNTLTIPTDCPQRNERMGWTGDAQAYTRTGIYQADLQTLFRQWMVSLRADQAVGDEREIPGGIGTTVPTFNKADDTIFAPSTTWSAAVCMVPWQLYNQYGDTRIIEENFQVMMDWLNGMAFHRHPEYPHLSSATGGLADHLALDGRTPPDLLNNAIYIRMMEVTAVMAEAIGRRAEAVLLRERHGRALEDWNKAYVDPETGRTRDLSGKPVHTQASYATPLNFNAFSPANRKRAEQHLARLVTHPADVGDASFPPYSITTGFSGTPNILPALSRAGFREEAFRMISNADYPSWLYPVTRGATSIWERWNSWDTAFSGVNQNSMNSFNHFALGAVGEWMFEYQLGITAAYDEGEAGYRHFVLQPSCGGIFTALEGSYDSNYGRICSAWTAEKGVMKTYRCTVPANTSATLYLPIDENAIQSYEEADGAVHEGNCIRLGQRTARYFLPAGTWEFTMEAGRVCIR